MKKVLCVGSVTTDIIISPVDSVPDAGTLRSVDSITNHVGGCAANAAMDMAKIGIPVALSCKVGKDSFGDFVRNTAAGAGVDVSGVVSDDKVPTTVSVVCVSSSGERSFLYNPASTSEFSIDDIPESLIDGCDIVFVAGAMLLSTFDGAQCAEFFKKCREKGKLTVMDTAWDFDDIWLPKIEAALPGLDIFMPSIDEAKKLSGLDDYADIAEYFISKGVKNVIIKIGKKGAYFREASGEKYVLPTYEKIKPVDTTGAGDSFCAGFLSGLCSGWDYKESGRFANAVATHCVTAIGASTGIKPMSEIKKFMAENEI